MNWDLVLNYTDAVATALHAVSVSYDATHVNAAVPRHAQFATAFELAPTGLGNGANTISVGTTIVAGLPGPDAPSVANICRDTGYHLCLFSVTAKSADTATVQFIGTMTTPADAAAAKAAAVAAFGPRLGPPIVVPRARFPNHLKTKAALATLVATLLQPDANPPLHMLPAGDTSGLLVAAMRTTEAKSAATTRLLKLKCLLDDPCLTLELTEPPRTPESAASSRSPVLP